jgi:subtilisin
MAKRLSFHEDPVYRLPPDYVLRPSVVPLAETYDWSQKLYGWSELWKLSAGEGQIVCVADTGCDLKHKDLEGAILGAKDFTGSRIGPDDIAGHGSWCVSCIAAQANDNGIVGIAHKCKGVLVAKVLGDSGGGSEKSIANGLIWGRKEGARFFSLSLGGGPMSNSFRKLLAELVADGCFIFAAAGNDGADVNYPAAWPECLSVGAHDQKRQLTKFTSKIGRLDIIAPGVAMLGCAPGNKYQTLSGTSMATPMACAVGMCAVAKHESVGGTDLATSQDMREHLQRTADKKGNQLFIRPDKLLKEVLTPPVTPTPPGPEPDEVLVNGLKITKTPTGCHIEVAK